MAYNDFVRDPRFQELVARNDLMTEVRRCMVDVREERMKKYLPIIHAGGHLTPAQMADNLAMNFAITGMRAATDMNEEELSYCYYELWNPYD